MASSLQVTSCGFLRLSCRSDQHQLFSASYARSNKKRSSKVESAVRGLFLFRGRWMAYLTSAVSFFSSLLRCFPHCCPDHQTRSYCGCSLHVLVTFASGDQAVVAYQSEDLVVCARFEAASAVPVSGAGEVVTALPTDSIVALPSTAVQPSGQGASENDWVRAEKASDAHQRQFPENSVLYVLNNHRSPQWYYGYESGSTKTQREMRHVLAVYVLLLHPMRERHTPSSGNASGHSLGISSPTVARLATVVAREASPPFAMISYRRQNGARRGARDRAARQTTAGVASETVDDAIATNAEPLLLGFASAAQLSVALRAGADVVRGHVVEVGDGGGQNDGALRRPGRNSAWAYTSRPDTLSGVDEWAPSTQPTVARSVQQDANPALSSLAIPLGCPICHAPLTLPSHALHRDTIEKLHPLLLLRLFVRFVPLDAFAFYFVPMDFRIQRRWLAKIPPTSRTDQARGAAADAAARTLVADVAAAFSLKNFTVGPSGDNADADVVADPVREQLVLQSCADLLLDAFSSLRVQQILSVVEARDETSAPSISCELFGQLVADLFEELTQLLAARSINNSRFDASSEAADRVTGPASIPALVDEILSLVYAEPKYLNLRRSASSLLLRRDGVLDAAVQDLFQAFMTQERQARDALSPVRGANASLTSGMRAMGGTSSHRGGSSWLGAIAGPHRQATSSLEWCRRWFLVPTSVFITPLETEDEFHGMSRSPSLLLVVALLRCFASVDVVLERTRLIVAAATAVQLPGVPSTVLHLDGQPHAFTSLPNGLSVAASTAMLGDNWGVLEYEGRVADDGASLELVVRSTPAANRQRQPDFRDMSLSPTEAADRMYRLRFLLTLEPTGEIGEDCLSVFAEVSTIQRASQSVDQRVGAPSSSRGPAGWRSTLEVDATYLAIAGC